MFKNRLLLHYPLLTRMSVVVSSSVVEPSGGEFVAPVTSFLPYLVLEMKWIPSPSGANSLHHMPFSFYDFLLSSLTTSTEKLSLASGLPNRMILFPPPLLKRKSPGTSFY